MTTVGGPLDDFQDRSDRDSLNLGMTKSLELDTEMRWESADFIGARSGSIGCKKAGYRAAAHPVSQNTRKLAQTGRVHIVHHGKGMAGYG
jgi:hypothetical protein